MTKIFYSKVFRQVCYVLFFVFAVAATFMLMPQGRSLNRYFEIGKPWSYDLLTAPIDFAIYKTDAQLKTERDSALCMLEPYFSIDRNVRAKQVDNMIHSSLKELPKRQLEFIKSQLNYIYSVGVMALPEMKQLNAMNVSNLLIVDDDYVANKMPKRRFFTSLTAYSYLIEQCEQRPFLNVETLKQHKIESYIQPNMVLDEHKTNQAKKDIIDGVMTTSGMVQMGERIVDKGEVVSPETYQILNSLKLAHSDEFVDSKVDIWSQIGQLLIIIILYFLLFIYFYLFRSKVLNSIRETLFMIFMCLGMLAILSVVQHFTSVSDYIVPFAMLPLVVRVFFDSRTALYVHIITILIASQMTANPIEFVLIQILAGMVAVSSLKDMNSRAKLVRSAGYIFLVYVFTYTGIELSHNVKLDEIDLWMYLIFSINALTLLFAYGLIFIIEKIFGFLSGVTLVELSNINTPLLMEFSEKCPGTFQHVLQVSNLSVEVAKKIGANALLVRTGAIYHDIGKMSNPMLYTENQLAGVNPLNSLPYEEAAQIIISHVTEGVRIAQKAGLPHQIIEFISMHHGKSKVRYFYNSYKNQFPDKEIDESLFTYPGPLPNSRESVILMMSDAVEAASRSLKSYSEEDIDKMVEGVVNSQIADGQFKQSPISFRDVELAKSVFKDKLKNIYHERVSYPKLKKQN